MIHPEGLPDSREIQTPITQAEIALQGFELDDIELHGIRAKRELAMRAIDPDQIEFAARLLTAIQPGDDKDPKSGPLQS